MTQRLLLLAAIALIAILGFRQSPGEIKTTSLQIVNKQGKPAALFYGTEEGFGGYLYGRAVEGADYQPAIKLEGSRVGGQIDLFDENGRQVIEVTRGTDGGAITIFNNKTNRPVASVYADRDDGARIELNATDGSERLFLQSDLIGAGMKMILPRGIPALSLYSSLDGGYLALYDEKGNTVQRLPKSD